MFQYKVVRGLRDEYTTNKGSCGDKHELSEKISEWICDSDNPILLLEIRDMSFTTNMPIFSE